MCFSECFESLCEGLQNVVSDLRKVPQRHRTDRLSTAVNNMSTPAEFGGRFAALLRYYGVEGEKDPGGQILLQTEVGHAQRFPVVDGL